MADKRLTRSDLSPEQIRAIEERSSSIRGFDTEEFNKNRNAPIEKRGKRPNLRLSEEALDAGYDVVADAQQKVNDYAEAMKKGDLNKRQTKAARKILEELRVSADVIEGEFLYENDYSLMADSFDEEVPDALPSAREQERKQVRERFIDVQSRAYNRQRNFEGYSIDEETGEPSQQVTRQKTIRERRRRQKENRKARRLRNAELTKLGNLFADGKADVTSAVNGLVSMYNKAAASGGGAAFIASLADDLFEDNKKAASKFFNLIKSNPAAAFQMAGKGLMAMAMDGLPLTAALMPLMPVAANQDEQELLNSITDLNDDPFIKNPDNSDILNITGSNYYKRFMTAVKNELSLDGLMDENITTEKFSPEAIGAIKSSLDKYFAANPEQTQVDTSSAFLGILYQDTLLDMITATRNPDGSYQLSDASDPSKNNNILAAGRSYGQGLGVQIDQPLTANSDWFANQFQEDSINIDIKIPPVINAVSDAMDDYFGIEETALFPKFRPNPLTQSRLNKMNAVLSTKDIPVVETPGFTDILGFNEVFARNRNAGQSVFTWRGDNYTTLSRDEQELLDGENTSMDTQGGQEPEGGIERGGSSIVQEGNAEATS